MKEFVIDTNDAGSRLDKFCARILKKAPKSFFYKMFRKKNITLNGKKAQGMELLKEQDVVRFFLSDETFLSLQKDKALPDQTEITPDIVYEDDHVLIVNKPAGILSQKANEQDVSMNEICLQYLAKTNAFHPNDPAEFIPSVCNRLDRNTSGLLLVGKTLAGSRMLSHLLKDRSLHKYYVCLVKGILTEPFTLKGYLKKDTRANRVTILSEPAEDASYVETVFTPLSHSVQLSLLEVELITGKTHQIRAHLSSIGHPILGDPKYGDADLNRSFHCKRQMLHAYKLQMPDLTEPFQALSGKTVNIGVPQEFEDYLKRGTK